ncbi:MAG: hypothetical protein ACKODG_01670, partial [Betaproteobacteria bacterium]
NRCSHGACWVPDQPASASAVDGLRDQWLLTQFLTSKRKRPVNTPTRARNTAASALAAARQALYYREAGCQL